jgi:hypothetical protein
MFSFVAPSNVLLIKFLWFLKRPSIFENVICGVPCLLICFLTRFSSLFYLGGLGFFSSLLQIFIFSQWLPMNLSGQI